MQATLQPQYERVKARCVQPGKCPNLEATHPFAGRHAALVLTESGAWENHLCKSGESIIVAMRDRRGRSGKWKVHRLRKWRALRSHRPTHGPSLMRTWCSGHEIALTKHTDVPHGVVGVHLGQHSSDPFYNVIHDLPYLTDYNYLACN